MDVICALPLLGLIFVEFVRSTDLFLQYYSDSYIDVCPFSFRRDVWVLLLTPQVTYAGKHSKIFHCTFPHLINHLNGADHMADKTLEMWLWHAKSQVAWNQEWSQMTQYHFCLLSSSLAEYLPPYFTCHFLVHLITSVSLVFFFHFPATRRKAIPLCKELGADSSLFPMSVPPNPLLPTAERVLGGALTDGRGWYM